MSRATEMTSFSFYGSDFEPNENDHAQHDVPLHTLDDAIAYARDLLPDWGCDAVEVSVNDQLMAIVTPGEALTGDELAERLAQNEEDVWEVSFYGSNDAPGDEHHTDIMELSSWEDVVSQAQSLLEQWGADHVDVKDEDQNIVARITEKGAFLPDDHEGEESFYPEYDFYASDCDLTDPTNDRMEMGLVFDDLDGAVDHARELLSGWGCDYVDVHQDEELIARVTPEGVLLEEDLTGEEEAEGE
ncbi:MAG: hypothetical protein NTZ09_02310 [Candidatus Hydrogenedentes bacterium]|nr:hypothetical protein [Candidatus Hydrogenedentota bacterium]